MKKDPIRRQPAGRESLCTHCAIAESEPFFNRIDSIRTKVVFATAIVRANAG